MYAVHSDESTYKDANVFKPWRFVESGMDSLDLEGEDRARQPSMQQFVATGPEYLIFGYGKHAWYVS